jgi:hypothetical protein
MSLPWVLGESLHLENAATHVVILYIYFILWTQTTPKKFELSDGSLNEIMLKQIGVVFFKYNCYIYFNGKKLAKFFDMAPPQFSDYLGI